MNFNPLELSMSSDILVAEFMDRVTGFQTIGCLSQHTRWCGMQHVPG